MRVLDTRTGINCLHGSHFEIARDLGSSEIQFFPKINIFGNKREYEYANGVDQYTVNNVVISVGG